MKVVKYIYFLFVFVFFIASPISVSASESMDFIDILGIDEDEFLSMLDEYYTCELAFPSTYDDSLDYRVEETIKLSSNGIACSWSSSYSGSSVLSFGSSKIVTNKAQVLNLVLYNDGELLFDNPGTLNLLLYTYGNDITVSTTSGGVTTSSSYSGSSTGYTSTPVSIDNSLGNLTKVQVTVYNGIVQSSGDTYLAGGISKYGYILIQQEGPDAIPVVPGDTSGIFTFLFGFMSQYIESLFYLEIVSGVTFGYFILACAILGVVFSFFLSRLIK